LQIIIQAIVQLDVAFCFESRKFNINSKKSKIEKIKQKNHIMLQLACNCWCTSQQHSTQIV